MTEEIEYCSKVLDGITDDETCFSLLYMPDDRNDWMSDKILRQANPLAIEIEENFEYLVRQRKKALEIEGALTNFKTKHLNIFVNGNVAEVYIDLEDFRKCKLEEEFSWDGRGVYVGLDLSQTTDNTCVSMATYDWETNITYIKSMAFIPENAIEKKTKLEKVDYALMEEQGFCISCGDNVIDYSVVEGYIMTLEEKYGVQILGVGYDRYNCISTANKLINNDINAIEVKQHSSVLHPATKFLKERVLSGLIRYEANRLLEINVANTRESLDTNLNGYVNKKKSTGRVDMVVATINAMALLVDEISDDLEANIIII